MVPFICMEVNWSKTKCISNDQRIITEVYWRKKLFFKRRNIFLISDCNFHIMMLGGGRNLTWTWQSNFRFFISNLSHLLISITNPTAFFPQTDLTMVMSSATFMHSSATYSASIAEDAQKRRIGKTQHINLQQVSFVSLSHDP